jgi:hypothetical protein
MLIFQCQVHSSSLILYVTRHDASKPTTQRTESIDVQGRKIKVDSNFIFR